MLGAAGERFSYESEYCLLLRIAVQYAADMPGSRLVRSIFSLKRTAKIASKSECPGNHCGGERKRDHL